MDEADWSVLGQQVLEALRSYFAEGKPLMEPVDLIEARLETDPDGMPVLLAVYDHHYHSRRVGLRRRLDGTLWMDDSAEGIADEIAFLEISEPLGAYYYLLVEDDQGVWWWGDGFPELPAP